MKMLSLIAERRRSAILIGWVVGVTAVAVLPFLGVSMQVQRFAILTVILALMVSGMNLTFGWSGELSLATPALYAAGAYAAGYIAIHVVNDVLIGVVAGALTAIVFGLILGIPGLRLGGWTLTIVSLFIVLLIPPIVAIVPADILGGSIGMIGIPAPRILGFLLSREAYFVVVVVIAAIWFAIYRNTVKSRVGDVLLTVQAGGALAPSLGLSRYRYKLLAYVMGAVPAGIAGALYANLDRFLGLESFGVLLAIYVLAASIVAGTRSIYAIFVGAAIIQGILMASAELTDFAELAFGTLLVLGGLVFGGGISALLAVMARRVSRRFTVQTPTPDRERESAYDFGVLNGADLTVESVSKNFGGTVALQDVTFRAKAGQVTALIGPNGSGKTTMLNIINGFYRLDSGDVRLGSTSLARLTPARVARHGVARTFQTPLVTDGLTTTETVATGSIASESVSIVATALRLPSYRRIRERELARARGIIEELGLGAVADLPASSLSLGTRRMAELARAFASDPAIILLDEVASGLDTDEVIELAKVLRTAAAAGGTVILVEHNFALVRELANHVVVLADGQVLVEGAPHDIERHPDVKERFLGDIAGFSGTSLNHSPVEA